MHRKLWHHLHPLVMTVNPVIALLISSRRSLMALLCCDHPETEEMETGEY